jgi:hypothetical protein
VGDCVAWGSSGLAGTAVSMALPCGLDPSEEGMAALRAGMTNDQ